jgi:CRP-like cAMP-binding protein
VASTDEIIEHLGRTDLFAGLSPKVLKQIERDGEEQRFEPGALVTVEGAQVGGMAPFSRTGVFFHLVLDGTGEVRQQGQPIGTVRSGSYFGELSLIDGEPRSADVVAGDDGLTTFALTKWTFEALLEQHPEVAVPMLRVVASRLRAAEAKLG